MSGKYKGHEAHKYFAWFSYKRSLGLVTFESEAMRLGIDPMVLRRAAKCTGTIDRKLARVLARET